MVNCNSFIVACGILFCTLLISCDSSESPDEYIKNVTKSEQFNKTKSFQNGITVKCSFMPSELVALNELPSVEKFSKSQLLATYQVELAKASDKLFFKVSLAHSSGNPLLSLLAANKEEYAFVISELNYNMLTAAYLVTDNRDTINAVGYQFLNSYGLKPDIDLIYVYPKPDERNSDINSITLHFESKLIGQYNSSEFKYGYNSLSKKQPTIIF